EILSDSLNDYDRDQRVIHYTTIQAKALSKMGVNVNVSPVVDLKTDNPFNSRNAHTQIHRRAISQDKFVIANVASTYCNILRRYNIFPTLKHFPGLGNVKEDTHFYAGELNKSKEYLTKNDWYPFKEAIRSTDAFMMIGHVKLNKVDSKNAASFSKKVIQEVIRQDWGHNGILMSDDLNMGAIYGNELGIGGVAVKALNAGVDLLLVSYDGDQYFRAMYALIQADNHKKLDIAIIGESVKRIGLARQLLCPIAFKVRKNT
ncbi:MAG: glycoside hydrolase family 3 protein, partial [Deltaproteobacteria bacterium]|nr:glycoside hydrolase family 3 protein [Deltaproteobacteria bacterium]